MHRPHEFYSQLGTSSILMFDQQPTINIFNQNFTVNSKEKFIDNKFPKKTSKISVNHVINGETNNHLPMNKMKLNVPNLNQHTSQMKQSSELIEFLSLIDDQPVEPRKTSQQIAPSSNQKAYKKFPIPIVLQAPSFPSKRSKDKRCSSLTDQREINNIRTSIPEKTVDEQTSIPIDLEQLCRSLTTEDLGDQLIREKILELKQLVDQRRNKIEKPKHMIESTRNSIDHFSKFIPSKSVDFYMPYNYSYEDILNHHNTRFSQSKTSSNMAI